MYGLEVVGVLGISDVVSYIAEGLLVNPDLLFVASLMVWIVSSICLYRLILAFIGGRNG